MLRSAVPLTTAGLVAVRRTFASALRLGHAASTATGTSSLTASSLHPYARDHAHDHHDHDGGHGHSHAPLDMTKLSREAARITWVGVWTNVALAITKGVAGIMCNSASLLADAGHSASDLVSDGMTLLAVRFSRRPPSKAFPFGYGRAETLGAMSVSALLIGGAGGISWHSYEHLIGLFKSSMATSGAELAISETTIHPAALSIILASIVLKEVLFHATVHIAHKQNSEVLLANAWHHRSDAFSSIVALVGVGGAIAGYPVLDPLGGLLVSVTIGWMGIGIGWRSIRELLDASVPYSTLSALNKSLLTLSKQSNAVDQVVAFEDLRARRLGPFVAVDLSLRMSPFASAQTASLAADAVRTHLKTSMPSTSEVLVQVKSQLDPPPSEHLPPPSYLHTLEDSDAPQAQSEGATVLPLSSTLYSDVTTTLSSIPNVLGVASVARRMTKGEQHLTARIIVADEISIAQAREIAVVSQRKLQTRLPDIAHVHVSFTSRAEGFA